MAKFPLDLSSFKKAKEDAKSTTLEHKDGHTIILAHGKLPTEHQKMLKALPLADGGKIPGGSGSPATDDEKAKQIQDSSQQSGWQPKQWAKNLKEGLGIASESKENAMAKGGEVEHCKCDVTEGDNPQCPKHKPRKALAEGGGPEEAPTEQEAAATDLANSPEMQGEMEAQAGDSAPGTPAPLPPESAQQVAPTPPTPPSVSQELLDERNKFAEDLQNGHITPKTYGSLFADKGTLGKIGTVFGLMLSGAGSGLTGQPNALLQIMGNQINNDLEAQKTSKANAQNFLRINQRQQELNAHLPGVQAESDIKSHTAAKMAMDTAAFHSLVENTKKLPQGSPQRQQAEQIIGILGQQLDTLHSNLADKAQAMGALAGSLVPAGTSANDPEAQFQSQDRMLRLSGNDKMADYKTDRHFPGLAGQSSVPLSGGDRESINSGIDFDQKLHRFMDWTKSHSGDINPADRHAGEALAAELQGAYRQATHGGVYKEGEQNFISKLIDSTPTKFFNSIRVMPQLTAIAGENQKRVNQLVKSKGFPGYSGSKSSTSTTSEGATGTYNGKPVVFKGGKWQYK